MQEPNALIRWTIFIFAGGDAGIFGALSIAAIAILIYYPGRKRQIRPFYIGVVVVFGLMLIACGSLPLPILFQLITMIWMILLLSQVRYRTAQATSPTDQPVVSKISPNRLVLFLCPIAWLLALTVIELPFHFWVVPEGDISNLMVIADSVTAGLNDHDDTWPRQLARAAQVEILDASQPGATVASAPDKACSWPIRRGLMIIEIGGNDMLEGQPVAKFENELDLLLTDVVRPGRTVLMFELPLPPLCAAYGTAQRRQAAKHRIRLIPKRLFASIITTSGATVDGIHLSTKGQSQMMDLVQRLLGNRLRPGRGIYRQIQ